MPKIPLNYSTCCIYKIEHIENDNLVYVGHTTNFTKRKCQHKYISKSEKNKVHNFKVYQMISDNGGWDMFRMIEIEKYPCNDKREAEKRECEVMKELKANMNSIMSYTSDEEKKEKSTLYKKNYYAINKDEVTEKQKMYNKTRIEELKQYKKEYSEINKDKQREQKKEWYEKNKEKVKAERKEHYNNNKKQLLEKQKIYNENNKEKIKDRKRQLYIKSKKEKNLFIEDKPL
jgi:hypothetical protein